MLFSHLKNPSLQRNATIEAMAAESFPQKCSIAVSVVPEGLDLINEIIRSESSVSFAPFFDFDLFRSLQTSHFPHFPELFSPK